MQKLFFAAILAASTTAVAQTPAADWSAWNRLIGEWIASDPLPGGATGGTTFALELQGRVLVRKNFADYGKGKPRHEDLIVMYQDGATTRADYWDNEGHVIHYVATVEEGGRRFRFLSDAGPGPHYRLTYDVEGVHRTSGVTKQIFVTFEFAPPDSPDAWRPYILRAGLYRK